MALFIWLVAKLGVPKFKFYKSIIVNVAVYAMRFATGPDVPPMIINWGRGRGTLEGSE